MDGYEGEELGRITAILTGIFDEMKDLKKKMKKGNSGNKELRKPAGVLKNQWRDEKR